MDSYKDFSTSAVWPGRARFPQAPGTARGDPVAASAGPPKCDSRVPATLVPDGAAPRATHPAERLKPLHYPLSSAVATVGRRVLVSVSVCGPFMHGSARFPRRKSRRQKNQNILADYHPSEGRSANKRTVAGCGRLRPGCGIWGILRPFWTFLPDFLVEMAALPGNGWRCRIANFRPNKERSQNIRRRKL